MYRTEKVPINFEKDDDPINPNHYKSGGLEVIDVIEKFNLGYNLGNAIKYLLRAGRKGDYSEQLLKARWYIERELQLRSPTHPAEENRR